MSPSRPSRDIWRARTRSSGSAGAPSCLRRSRAKRPGWRPRSGGCAATRRFGRRLDRREPAMTPTNAELLRSAYDAFARGDIPTVLQTLAEDIAWHVPGRSPLSGDYRGHEEVVGFFSRAMELSGGTLRVEAEDVIGDGER